MGIGFPPSLWAWELPFCNAASGDSLEIHQVSRGLMGSGAGHTDGRAAQYGMAIAGALGVPVKSHVDLKMRVQDACVGSGLKGSRIGVLLVLLVAGARDPWHGDH
jgi:hypothetical protein